ncbi:MAG TPA: FHA domain-containing protein [Gemmatimonadaceae bacterium]|nr:FHA domain-containing protein [Gemmatimonadaceae bacterium]
MAVLEHEGRSIALGPDTVIGSGAQATHRVQGQDLAARHFVIRLDPAGGGTVSPSGDACVVALDGMQVPRTGAPLRDGAVITAGQGRFVFGAGAQAPSAPPAPHPAACLVDTTARRAYSLERRTVQIGRDAGAGIVLKDPTVSRFHADIRSEAGGHVLYSSGATGTFVNEEQVSRPRLLVDGDEIRIGRMTLVFALTPPPGMKVHTPGGADDPAAINRRSTQLDMRAYPDAGRTRANVTPLLVGAVVVLSGVVAFLLLR